MALRRIHLRYRREFLPALAAYLFVMLLAWPQLRHAGDNTALRIALALLPMLPVLLLVRALVRLVLGSDELEQRIHLVGLAVATTCVGMASLAGGFLAAAGVVRLDGTVLIWIFPALTVCYAAGRTWASRRYGLEESLMCLSERDGSWRPPLLGATFVAIAWLGHGHLLDYQVGVFAGLAAGCFAWALHLALRRWWRGRSAGRGKA